MDGYKRLWHKTGCKLPCTRLVYDVKEEIVARIDNSIELSSYADTNIFIRQVEILSHLKIYDLL